MPALSFDSKPLESLNDTKISRLVSALQTKVAGQVLYSDSDQSSVSVDAVTATGQISPVTGIQTTGNAFPIVVAGQIGFTWNGSTLTLYWDGTNGSQPFVVKRADGTNLSIPKGSLTLSGLSPSTMYGFAPFVSVAQPQRVSFAAGNAGSPRFAFSPSAPSASLTKAVQQQSLTSNERLTNGLIYFTTTGAGSSNASSGTSASGDNPYPGQE